MKRTIETYLEAYSLASKVDFVCSAVEIGLSKKEINFWKYLTRGFNIDITNSIVVGDNPIDDFEVPKSIGFNAVLTEQNSLSNIYRKLLF